jgi:ubiquinone/menaquinone biosynthesis C-methylase UbiE
MGHDDRERRRLSLQASIINPFTERLLILTERLLIRAGISAGMRVLDVGCGVGEVSILKARLFGPHGEVTGIDMDEGALAIARRKAEESGFAHLGFVHGDVLSHRPARPVDAVIGRHILIHTRDPLAML